MKSCQPGKNKMKVYIYSYFCIHKFRTKDHFNIENEEFMNSEIRITSTFRLCQTVRISFQKKPLLNGMLILDPGDDHGGSYKSFWSLGPVDHTSGSVTVASDKFNKPPDNK